MGKITGPTALYAEINLFTQTRARYDRIHWMFVNIHMYIGQQMGRVIGKCFLYSFLREQPIWHSLRFWNAAFFDAVQCERARRPVCTSEDGSEEKVDDSEFQENVTFGQLGTFTCNMRSFGLSKDLCLEFLRKQSTIANLSAEKQKLLKDNILYSKE